MCRRPYKALILESGPTNNINPSITTRDVAGEPITAAPQEALQLTDLLLAHAYRKVYVLDSNAGSPAAPSSSSTSLSLYGGIRAALVERSDESSPHLSLAALVPDPVMVSVSPESTDTAQGTAVTKESPNPLAQLLNDQDVDLRAGPAAILNLVAPDGGTVSYLAALESLLCTEQRVNRYLNRCYQELHASLHTVGGGRSSVGKEVSGFVLFPVFRYSGTLLEHWLRTRLPGEDRDLELVELSDSDLLEIVGQQIEPRSDGDSLSFEVSPHLEGGHDICTWGMGGAYYTSDGQTAATLARLWKGLYRFGGREVSSVGIRPSGRVSIEDALLSALKVGENGHVFFPDAGENVRVFCFHV